MKFQSRQSLGIVFFIGIVALLISAYILLDLGNKEKDPHASSLLLLTTHEGGLGLTLEQVTEKGESGTALPEFAETVVDYASGGDVEVLVRNEEGVHVLQMREGADDWYEISRSPYEKREVSVTHGGAYVAYAERDGVVEDGLQLEAWTVYVYDRFERELISIATGYKPQFITFGSGKDMWEALVFSSPDGIGVLNLDLVSSDDMAYQIYDGIVAENISSAVLFSERVSEGAAYAVVYDPVVEAYNVFAIPDTHFALSAKEQIVDADYVLGIKEDLVYFAKGNELYAYRIDSGEEPRRIMNIEYKQGKHVVSVLNEAKVSYSL